MKDRISKVIENSGLSKAKVAEKLNVSGAFITKLCNGSSNPSDRTISDICREFHVNEKWLRTGEEPMEVIVPQQKRLENFFADVLATAPDERSAFVASLDTLPQEFWGMVADLARTYADNLAQQNNKED